MCYEVCENLDYVELISFFHYAKEMVQFVGDVDMMD